MCEISTKIKFCSCVSDDVDVDQLNHYWTLSKKRKSDLMTYVLGLMMLPTENIDPYYQSNVLTLESRLNEPDAFDFDPNFKNGYVLDIVINNKSESHQIFNYTFKFSKGKWKHKSYDSYDLINDFYEIGVGKMKNVLKRKKRN
jgi:hypothetical protein